VGDYLQPAQDEDAHPPQLEPLGVPEGDELKRFPMPKQDISFLVLFDPHFSHTIDWFESKISLSNSAPHAVQQYS